jgi:hypothetical protein
MATNVLIFGARGLIPVGVLTACAACSANTSPSTSATLPSTPATQAPEPPRTAIEGSFLGYRLGDSYPVTATTQDGPGDLAPMSSSSVPPMSRFVVAEHAQVPTGIESAYVVITPKTHTILGIAGVRRFSRDQKDAAHDLWQRLELFLTTKYGKTCPQSGGDGYRETELTCADDKSIVVLVGLHDWKTGSFGNAPSWTVIVETHFTEKGKGKSAWDRARSERDQLTIEAAERNGTARGL